MKAGMETPKLPVYFICHDCGRLYLAQQQRRRSSGHFHCTDCGAAVHHWSHHHDFTDWRRL
jgi:predicted RNA-binding Zn-ribbon protein involved in translation (DUF1610 family)